MKADSPQVQEAREQAGQARHKMMQTLHELTGRLAPGTLARDAWEGAKTKGADLAEDAVDAVRKRPVAATGALAAVAMFLAREPLMDLAGKLWNGKSKHKAKQPKRKPNQEPVRGSRRKMETVE
ncbi:MAG TPA: DUF3618 domain-containing protein [Sphingomicrobium sp.]|nr:DUF3618 domain-containing protein [Sphingomicrobium sp.]